MTIIFLGVTEIVKKYKLFILTTAMLAVGLIAVVYAFIVYDTYHFPTKTAKSVYEKDLDNIYSIRFGVMSIITENDRLREAYNMFKEIEAVKDVYSCGAYCYGNDNNMVKLMITPSLLDYVGISDSNGQKLDFSVEPNSTYGKAYIGKTLCDEYPVGSIYVDSESGNSFQVVGIIRNGSRWMPDYLYAEESVNLDDAIILDLDFICANDESIGNLVNALDNVVIISDNKNIKQEVDEIIIKYDFDIAGVFKLSNLLDNYEKDMMDNAGENYIFPFVILVAAIMISGICTRIYLINNKKDYGILMSNGFGKLDLCGMVIIEKLVSLALAEVICFIYWLLKRKTMIDFLNELYWDTMVFQAVIAVIIFLLMVEYPIRYILKNQVCTLLRKDV